MVMAESVWRLQCFAFYAYRLSWFLHSAKIQHVTGRMAVLCHAYVKALCDSLAKLKYMKGKLWNIWLLEQLHTGCTLLILQWKRRRGIVRVLRQTLFILWWVSWKQNLVCGPVIQCNLSCNYSRIFSWKRRDRCVTWNITSCSIPRDGQHSCETRWRKLNLVLLSAAVEATCFARGFDRCAVCYTALCFI